VLLVAHEAFASHKRSGDAPDLCYRKPGALVADLDPLSGPPD
jgi:hypothetical protein